MEPLKTFKEFLGESILLEMPHITLDSGKKVDLELEVHSSMSPPDFMQYINDWVSGKPISSKNPGFKMQVNKDSIHDFSNQLLHLDYVRLFVIKYYGQQVWKELERLLKTKMTEK